MIFLIFLIGSFNTEERRTQSYTEIFIQAMTLFSVNLCVLSASVLNLFDKMQFPIRKIQLKMLFKIRKILLKLLFAIRKICIFARSNDKNGNRNGKVN